MIHARQRERQESAGPVCEIARISKMCFEAIGYEHFLLYMIAEPS